MVIEEEGLNRVVDVYENTSNSRVWALAHKLVMDHRGEISCSFCPWHRGENGFSQDCDRSWKNYRRHQYKGKKHGDVPDAG